MTKLSQSLITDQGLFPMEVRGKKCFDGITKKYLNFNDFLWRKNNFNCFSFLITSPSYRPGIYVISEEDVPN